jgi:hypothetical protein
MKMCGRRDGQNHFVVNDVVYSCESLELFGENAFESSCDVVGCQDSAFC